MSKEMTVRGRAYHQYRYRRFQALDDGLTLFFWIRDQNAWVNITDICIGMEWDENNFTIRRRVRRICESLKRVGRVEIHNQGSKRGSPMFIRAFPDHVPM